MDEDKTSEVTNFEDVNQMFKDIEHVTKVNFMPSPLVYDNWKPTFDYSSYEFVYDPGVVTSMDMFLDFSNNRTKIDKSKLISVNDSVLTTKPRGKVVLVINNN